uniref:Nucleophosmin n=1 Tax=Bos taurus TaxID=9913 RepID=A0ABI0P0U6_BOVIN
MEDSMDMDMSPLRPQNYLFGCELKADRDYHFKVDNDENEHQLSLRTVSLGAGAKDELHVVEAEAMNYEGSPIKVTLATLKMSVQPTGGSLPKVEAKFINYVKNCFRMTDQEAIQDLWQWRKSL